MILRREVDTESEKRVLTGAIVSTDFLKTVASLYNPSYFVNDYARMVMQWCLDYFATYKKSPGKIIQDIFEVDQENIQFEDRDIIATLLLRISKQYEHGAPFNTDYAVDQAIGYFKRRELHIISENINVHLSRGDVAKAETSVIKQVDRYSRLARVEAGWSNPFTPQNIYSVFDDSDEAIFTFPGALGDLVGGFERDWFIGVMGPMKRGKTWWLQEIALQAVALGLRVVFISLEMKHKNINKRIFLRIAASGLTDERTIYPYLDCKKNQDGSCLLPCRTNFIKLLDGNGLLPDIGVVPEGYKLCEYCRTDRARRKDYSEAVLHVGEKRNPVDYYNVLDMMKAFVFTYGDHLRIKAYPKFSANTAAIERDLHLLEDQEGFIPDVIVIDYADILAPEDMKIRGREGIDDTWKTLGQMAAIRHCLVVTGTQSNRDSIEKLSVRQTHTSEDIRKIAHVDCMLTLNQVPWEKDRGIMRVGIAAHRHEDFSANRQVMVLQSLKHGQVHLDSHIVTVREKDDSKTTKK